MQALPMLLQGLINSMFSIVFCIIVIGTATPYFLVVLVPVAVLFYITQALAIFFHISASHQG